MRDLDQHAAAIDRAHLKTRDLAHAQASAIGRSQRRPVAQARNRFEKPHDLLGAERQVRPLSSTSGPACIYSEGGWIASAMTASARSDEAGRLAPPQDPADPASD